MLAAVFPHLQPLILVGAAAGSKVRRVVMGTVTVTVNGGAGIMVQEEAVSSLQVDVDVDVLQGSSVVPLFFSAPYFASGFRSSSC